MSYEPPTVTDISRDEYIDRVIATVRQHQGSDNSWPIWANELADEVVHLRKMLSGAADSLGLRG